ncbi:MAG TPA: DUF86 domain-containing protein [Candidatus Avamphibacillus intestinigallinarum]|nr:DUF86 domain-containing protein [Candidatus Avamphibacillus intestinigallinarum]
MYFVDVGEIEKRLTYMDQLIAQFKNEPKEQTTTYRLASERYVDVVVEVILDVGHQVIDGFLMRDAGSYEDIITILLEEDVISERNAVVYKDFIRLRKKVRKSYTSIERAEIEQMIHDNQDAITSYTNDIRNYIKNHDGVAHIFHQDI